MSDAELLVLMPPRVQELCVARELCACGSNPGDEGLASRAVACTATFINLRNK
eukprot:SAG25_NODE_9651_length_364_cov_0.584906_1_plen_53_part_00